MQVGDQLEATREPSNQYDRNAIRLSHCGLQVGHISKELAADLAPLLDKGDIAIKVGITDFTGGSPEIQHTFFGEPQPNVKNRGINIKIEMAYTEAYLKELEAEISPSMPPQYDFEP
jgi:hypothetical protein